MYMYHIYTLNITHDNMYTAVLDLVQPVPGCTRYTTLGPTALPVLVARALARSSTTAVLDLVLLVRPTGAAVARYAIYPRGRILLLDY